MRIKPMLGSFALDGIELVESAESRALVEHRVPGLAGSYFQDLGTVPNAIVIVGSRYGDDARDAFLTGIREIFNKGEPTTFVADINTATDITDVIIEDLQVAEIGQDVQGFRYRLKLRKYVEPPEPPSTDLLNADILDEALSVVDALNAIDALASLPNLGDPTGALRGALDGVQSATSELPAIVEQTRTVAESLPAFTQPAETLAPLLGDAEAGTGVAGVARLLEEVQGAGLSANLTASLDEGVSASISVDTSAVTGPAIAQFEQAVQAIPSDPAALTAPVGSTLETIRRVSSADLPSQLLSGISGLEQIQSLIPTDARELIDDAVEHLSGLKSEFIAGAFGELREWSASVEQLQAELLPLLSDGPGTLEDRLLDYLREKVDALVATLLPGGSLAAAIEGRLDGAISADLSVEMEALRDRLIAELDAARLGFEAGNLTNTSNLAAAQATYQQLVGLVASIVERLQALGNDALLSVEGLAQALQAQYDQLANIRIVDVGNIRDQFAEAIRSLEEAVRSVDLSVVRTTIEGLFEQVNAVIEQISLDQITSLIDGLRQQLQPVLDAVDGAVLEVVAAIRAVFTQVKQALGGVVSALGTFDEDGNFRFYLQQDIEQFLTGIRATLQGTLQPLLEQFRATVGQTLQQVRASLEELTGQIEVVVGQLEGLLQQASAQLASLDVAATMEAIRQQLEGMLSKLGVIDFDPVVDPVIAQINEMRDALKKIDVSAMSEFSIGALRVSVEVVTTLDFSAQITGALMAELDELLALPRQALDALEGRVEAALQQLAQLDPSVLLAPLDELFEPISAGLDALRIEALLEPLDAWYARLRAGIEQVSPASLLQPILDLYQRLEDAFSAVSPEALVAPLREAIDAIKAELGRLDLSGLSAELASTVERVWAAIDRIAPERLLSPLVSAFDTIMVALDRFDPAALLQPLNAIFEGLTTPIANLTADHARLIGEIFGALRAAVDFFDPRRVYELIRQVAAAVQARLAQINLGGLIAALRTPYDALHASFEASGGPVNVSLSASVQGLNPLRDPTLTQAVSGLQQFQARVSALASAQPPAALVSRYGEVKDTLEALIPSWAKEGVSAASIRRAFQLANPLNIQAEISQLWEAIKDQIRAFDPRILQEQVQATFERAKNALRAIDPQLLISQVSEVIDGLLRRLDAIDLQIVVDELTEIAGEIRAVIAGLNPRPIIDLLQGLLDEVLALADELAPATLLEELREPFEAARAVVARFDPAVMVERLAVVFADIQAVLAAVDVGVALEPIAVRLDQIRDELERSLKRTESAFNDMLAAIPV